MEDRIRLNIHTDPPEDTVMVRMNCAHCRIPHSVPPDYLKEYEDKLKELIKQGARTPDNKIPTIDDIWWCGACFAASMGLTGQLKTPCNHEVPPFKEEK